MAPALETSTLDSQRTETIVTIVFGILGTLLTLSTVYLGRLQLQRWRQAPSQRHQNPTYDNLLATIPLHSAFIRRTIYIDPFYSIEFTSRNLRLRLF